MTGGQGFRPPLPLYERVFRLAPPGTLEGGLGLGGPLTLLGRDKCATLGSKFSHEL